MEFFYGEAYESANSENRNDISTTMVTCYFTVNMISHSMIDDCEWIDDSSMFHTISNVTTI